MVKLNHKVTIANPSIVGASLYLLIYTYCIKFNTEPMV